jgi:hypothetical protein
VYAICMGGPGSRCCNLPDLATVRTSLHCPTDPFRLIICGHSLGAAVAVLLGCILRPDHPSASSWCMQFTDLLGSPAKPVQTILTCLSADLHVYAYGSPALLDAASAEACSPFVTVLAVGHDLVPRLSLHRLLRLRSDLLAAIYHAAMPKWRILAVRGVCIRNFVTATSRELHGAA